MVNSNDDIHSSRILPQCTVLCCVVLAVKYLFFQFVNSSYSFWWQPKYPVALGDLFQSLFGSPLRCNPIKFTKRVYLNQVYHHIRIFVGCLCNRNEDKMPEKKRTNHFFPRSNDASSMRVCRVRTKPEHQALCLQQQVEHQTASESVKSPESNTAIHRWCTSHFVAGYPGSETGTRPLRFGGNSQSFTSAISLISEYRLPTRHLAHPIKIQCVL